MKQDDVELDKFADLRRRAERVLQEQAIDPLTNLAEPPARHPQRGASERATEQALDELSPDDVLRMFHELQVHQIELEMQNEELRRAQGELQASRDRYVDLYDLAPVGYFTLDEQGLILEANLTGAIALGVERGRLATRPFSRFVLRDDQDLFYLHRLQVFGSVTRQMCELRMVRQDGSLFHAQLESLAVQDGASWRVTLSDVTARVRAGQLLQTLNAAALAMQRALTHEEIFDAVAKEFKKLGLSCALFPVDESQGQLSTRHVSYAPGALDAAMELLGLEHETFSMAVEKVDLYRKVMWEGETVFVERAEDVARQLLPGLAEGFAGRTASKLRVPKAIVAPLVVQDRAIGVFAVHSHDLIPGDLPAITAFAHQVAAAWHKATLLQDLEKSLTGQMRVLEALRESEERYRVFFESAPVSIGLFGADDRVLAANGAMLQLLGCADIEVEQIDLANLYQDPRDRARLIKDLQRDGCVHDLEVLWNRQDGAPICASLTATLLDLEGAEVFLILAQDATERTRALKALRESERKHRRLIQDSMDGIVVLQGLAIRFANRTLLEMFGCQKESDMVGRILTDFMSPQHRDMMLRSERARTRRKRAPERYEFRALRKDGAEFDAELFLSNVTFQGSAAQQGIVRDTSKRAREEESAPFARGA